MYVEIGYKASTDNVIARQMAVASNAWSVPTNASDSYFFGTTASTATSGQSTTQITPFIMIMSGPIPTDVNALTTLSAGWNNVDRKDLVQWGNSNVVGDGVLATVNQNTISFDTGFKVAGQSGTASWFWIGAKKWSSDINFATVYHSVIGTIGLFGSGSDLECLSTSVVAGNSYRLAGLKITFPLTFEF